MVLSVVLRRGSTRSAATTRLGMSSSTEGQQTPSLVFKIASAVRGERQLSVIELVEVLDALGVSASRFIGDLEQAWR